MADDARIPGKEYGLREAEKAVKLGVSASWLQKDRLREKPEIDFARYGRSVRYAEE
jgi:hypothetical protein